MEKQQLRAIANYLCTCHGTSSFLAALAQARSLSAKGELKSASLWNEIAEEVRRIDARSAERSASS